MIVMKFGGTSVQDAKAIVRVASIVEGRKELKPVVVVSAMSKVTDSLIAMSKAAAAGELANSLKIVRQLRQRHLVELKSLATGELAEQTAIDLDILFDDLQDVLRGVAALKELSKRSTDKILSFGEQLSSRLVVACFVERGLKAERFDSSRLLVTDEQYTHAAPLIEHSTQRLRAKLRPSLNAGRIPVLGGFIAGTVDGIPTTLGRGGSDFSAAIFGAALQAKRIEIWTDVDGMMTTDPRLCVEAQKLDAISFDEAAELAFFGAKVLHPATLIPAVEEDIPVHVLNSHNPECAGTCITGKAPHSRYMFRAIAAKKGLSIINLKSPRMLMAHGFYKEVFELFDRHAVSADLVSTSEISVSIVLSTASVPEGLIDDLGKLGSVEVNREKAIVCLVGENVKGQVGMAAAVFNAIAGQGVNISMISQGASEINISLVVDEADVPRAVSTLHTRFFGPEAPLRKAEAKNAKKSASAQNS